MNLVERVLGHPWVFDHVRPLAVGGIDMSPAYDALGCDDSSVVLDVGCGTGNALGYLQRFSSYLGVDTDPVAIRHAQARHAHRPNVTFECRRCVPEDFGARGVTHVCMIGLLHHVSDAEAHELLSSLRACPTLSRAVSLDIVYLPGHPYNNLLARFDRGRYCRAPAGYEALARRAGLRIEQSRSVRCHPKHGLVRYFVMSMVRDG